MYVARNCYLQRYIAARDEAEKGEKERVREY